MRRYRRPSLAQDARGTLAALTSQVLRKRSSKGKAEFAARLWNSQGEVVSLVRTQLEALVGDGRCMYCEHDQATDIEHFWPKSAFPEKTFVWENHLLACNTCNSNHKRTLFPLDAQGSPLLLDPTDGLTDPLDHLQYVPASGEYAGVTERGRQSVEVFGLSRGFLIKCRRYAFASLLLDLRGWVQARETNRPVLAEYLLSLLRAQPHTSMLRDFVRLVDQNAVAEAASNLRRANSHLTADDLESCVGYLEQYPEIRGWCDEL